MRLLDADKDVVSWTKKHKIKIPYTLNNNSKNYVPDFLISYDGYIVLEEVKGYEESSRKKTKNSCREKIL